MNKELLFITVIGKDKKGIVAKVSNLLYKHDINIEDISQRIMGGFFVMTMLVDIKTADIAMDKIATELEKIGQNMQLRIQLQHEKIFNKMHRI